MDGNRSVRSSLKAHQPNWRDKLRQNCLRRVKEEREHLLWKFRSSGKLDTGEKDAIDFAFKDIFSDELKKIKESGVIDELEEPTKSNDIWEYEGFDVDICDNEELLIEMQRLLYDDLKEEALRRELEAYEEEDDYLAQAAFEHLQLNEEENNKLWCPVCKKGEIRKFDHLIYCTSCEMRLDVEDDMANLDRLRDRLGEVSMEHLERGCKSAPNFCTDTIFSLTALFIKCQTCNTFEVVL